jgi:hypothetical protein
MDKSPKGLKRYAEDSSLVEADVSLVHHQKIKKIGSDENISSLNIPTYSDMICHAIR